MISRRQLVLGAAAASVAQVWSQESRATTARAVTLPELVGRSEHALVGLSAGSVSRWESWGGTRRIVTYSTVEVLQPIDGRDAPDASLVVRTLGGRVGSFGQLVHGSPKLTPGQTAVLFLTQEPDGILAVTAMAQGHYPLAPDDRDEMRLGTSPQVPHLLGEPGSAVRRLARRTVLEAEDLVCQHTLPR